MSKYFVHKNYFLDSLILNMAFHFEPNLIFQMFWPIRTLCSQFKAESTHSAIILFYLRHTAKCCSGSEIKLPPWHPETSKNSTLLFVYTLHNKYESETFRIVSLFGCTNCVKAFSLFSLDTRFLIGFYSQVRLIFTWEFLEEWGFLHHKVHQMWISSPGTSLPNGRGTDPHALWHSRACMLHKGDRQAEEKGSKCRR